jgi:hypothetical protein
MSGPPAPNGPQKWLQQTPHPLHTVPSIWQLVLMVAQVPTAAPLAILHTPVQHSTSTRQTSPVWLQ